MRIATWNVNSLRARIRRVEAWTEKAAPDVLCLQETKCPDDLFPKDVFLELGYEVAHYGANQWNGVAIASKVGLVDVAKGFQGKSDRVLGECRLVAATCGGVRVFCVYVPNGRTVDSEHYEAKIDWLSQLTSELDSAASVNDDIAICGDFNIAPRDVDVYDISKFDGATHVTSRERAALTTLCDWGLADAALCVQGNRAASDSPTPRSDEFTWWDYRGGSFHRGFGMRIDLALVSPSLAGRLTKVWVDREARKKGTDATSQPSDHAPLVVDVKP